MSSWWRHEDNVTSAAGLRMMEPHICIPVKGIEQMISLQAAMPNGGGLFSFLSLDSARGADTTYTGGKQNHTLALTNP